MENLLYSLMYFIHEEIDWVKALDPDRSIESQFDADFAEEHLQLGALQFQLHHGIDISENAIDCLLTFRELVARLHQLPRIHEDDFESFAESKMKILSDVMKKQPQLDLMKRRN